MKKICRKGWHISTRSTFGARQQYAVTARDTDRGRIRESLLRGHVVGIKGSGPACLGGFDVWSTLADVERQGNQKDHALVPRHCQVPRDEAFVIGVGEAKVRALEDAGTAAEDGSAAYRWCGRNDR